MKAECDNMFNVELSAVMNAESIKDLIMWLERHISVNVTIYAQSIGDISDSIVHNVNTVSLRKPTRRDVRHRPRKED